MRTATRLSLALLGLAATTAVGFLAYQAGFDAGVVGAEGVEVVRVVDGAARGFGFFPGFLFFPLVFFGFFALLRLAWWGSGPRRRWGGPPSRRRDDWEQRATDWHRRQHDVDTPSSTDDDRPAADRAETERAWPDAGT